MIHRLRLSIVAVVEHDDRAKMEFEFELNALEFDVYLLDIVEQEVVHRRV